MLDPAQASKTAAHFPSLGRSSHALPPAKLRKVRKWEQAKNCCYQSCVRIDQMLADRSRTSERQSSLQMSVVDRASAIELQTVAEFARPSYLSSRLGLPVVVLVHRPNKNLLKYFRVSPDRVPCSAVKRGRPSGLRAALKDKSKKISCRLGRGLASPLFWPPLFLKKNLLYHHHPNERNRSLEHKRSKECPESRAVKFCFCAS